MLPKQCCGQKHEAEPRAVRQILPGKSFACFCLKHIVGEGLPGRLRHESLEHDFSLRYVSSQAKRDSAITGVAQVCGNSAKGTKQRVSPLNARIDPVSMSYTHPCKVRVPFAKPSATVGWVLMFASCAITFSRTIELRASVGDACSCEQLIAFAASA